MGATQPHWTTPFSIANHSTEGLKHAGLPCACSLSSPCSLPQIVSLSQRYAGLPLSPLPGHSPGVSFYTKFCSHRGGKAEETRQHSPDAFSHHGCCQVNFFNTKETEFPWENGHGHLKGRQIPLCKQAMALASFSLCSSPGTCSNSVRHNSWHFPGGFNICCF